MEPLFASGRIVDLILAGVAVEAVMLALLRRRFGGGAALPALLANLASGAALMLALRAGLTGAPWPAVAGWMLAGLVAHATDLSLRARGGRDAAGTPVQEQARREARSRAAVT